MKKKEAVKIPTIPISDVVDGLARDFLLDGVFRGGGEFEDIPFPGEGGVSYYDMIFGLEGIDFSSEERGQFGRGASPGVRVVKQYIGNSPGKKGWHLHIHRVVLRDGVVDKNIGLSDVDQYVSIGMQTGQLKGYRGLINAPSLSETKSLYDQFLDELGEKRGDLIEAGFSERITGVRYSLLKDRE